MKSFELKLKEMLIENGMFETQANQVIELVKGAPENAAMQGRWSDSVNHYPKTMQAIWLSAKKTALKWIEEKFPDAWYKPMFQ